MANRLIFVEQRPFNRPDVMDRIYITYDIQEFMESKDKNRNVMNVIGSWEMSIN